MSKPDEQKTNRYFNALAATWHEKGMPEHDPAIAQKQYANSEKMEPLRKQRGEIESECPGIEFDAKHPRYEEYHKILSDISTLEAENIRIGHPEPDPERTAVLEKNFRLEEIADKEAQFMARLDELNDTPDTSETAEIKKALAVLSKEKARLTGQSSGSTEQTEAQQRRVKLRKAVRERMQDQYDRGDKVNRKQACKDFLHDTTPAAMRLRREAGVNKWEDAEKTLYKMTHGITVEEK